MSWMDSWTTTSYAWDEEHGEVPYDSLTEEEKKEIWLKSTLKSAAILGLKVKKVKVEEKSRIGTNF